MPPTVLQIPAVMSSLFRLGQLLLPPSISIRQTPHAGAPTPSPQQSHLWSGLPVSAVL